MLVQKYKVRLRGSAKAAPGNFVFPDNSSKTACGFISEYKSGVATIVLFGQTDTKDIKTPIEIISSKLTPEEVTYALVKVIDSSPKSVQEEWREVLANTLEDLDKAEHGKTDK